MGNNSETYEKAMEQFVLSWGEMATAWGINRTMAQIHALLYAESNPLDTDAIMKRLDVSRGSASMNLRNLMQWGLIHKVHFKGRRKDYYTAEKDVWSIVSTIIRERQQREIAPILDNLDQSLKFLEEKETLSPDEIAFKERIENFRSFIEMFQRFTDAFLPFIDQNHLGVIKKMVKLVESQRSPGKNKGLTSNS